MTNDNTELEQRIGQIESMVEQVDAIADPAIRAQMQDLLALILEYHGAGLERMVNGINDNEVITRLAADPLVASLLVLYDLHPQEVRHRVMAALDRVRPYLESHGGNVEVVSIAADTVRLRMEGSCDGCPSSAVTVKNAIEKAIFDAAPEIRSLIVDGMLEPTKEPKVFVQLGTATA